MIETILTFLATLTLGTVLPVLVLVVVGLVVIKALLNLIDKALEKTRLEKAASGLIKSLAKVALYLLLGMMVGEKLGIDVSGILALASVATLALSLAMQDMLSNIIGGFTLLTNHPFRSGDLVEIAGQTGVVQTIDITYTKLTTGDNKVISLPNSSVVASQIINYSTAGTRRVDITVSVSYATPIETVKQALVDAAAVPTALSDPAPFASVTEYGDSAIKYVLQVWTRGDDYWTTLFAVNENIKAKFDEHGVELTFPHLNVHLDK